MKKYYQIFVCISVLFCFSCKNEEPHQKSLFTCKDYKLDVPIESVDVETNGEKNGDTHFHSHSTDTEVFYSYKLFNSEAKAIEELKENEKKSLQVLRKGELKNLEGKKIGEKVVFYWEKKLQISETIEKRYNLLWTNNAMFNSISSESLSAIEEIEKNCNL